MLISNLQSDTSAGSLFLGDSEAGGRIIYLADQNSPIAPFPERRNIERSNQKGHEAHAFDRKGGGKEYRAWRG